MKITLPLTLLLTLVAANASAGASPAAKCAIAKTKAAGKNAVAQVKCWQKAIAAGENLADPECISAANQKLSDAIAKAEAKGGCGVEGDLSTFTAVATQCADDITGIVPDITSGCYAGASAMTQDSPFETLGFTGIEAANKICEEEYGGHMCTYTELLAADAAGDFFGVPDGTTFWLERDVIVEIDGVPSAPGKGGNCNDWYFTGNHLADGEYVTFSGGVPTYHFDNDTTFDGFSTIYVQPDLQCSDFRSIPCCISCEP